MTLPASHSASLTTEENSRTVVSPRSTLGTQFNFRRSAPNYYRLRLIVRLIWMACVYIPSAIAIAVFVPHVWWAWAIWGGVLAVRLVNLALLRRRTYAFGYAETMNELILHTGIMFENLEVIPYGRLQKVTVDSGPFERRAGLASVKIVTAAAGTDGEISGVTTDEADRLRRTLTQLAEANLEGL